MSEQATAAEPEAAGALGGETATEQPGGETKTGDAVGDEQKPEGEATPPAGALGDEKTGEETGESGGEATGPPEKYDLPETLETEIASAVSDAFREAGLTQEQADRLMALQGELAQQNMQRYAAFLADREKEMRADPDIGGANYQPMTQNVQRLCKQIDPTDQFRQALIEAGCGTDVRVMKPLNQLWKAIGEDRSIGNTTGGGTPSLRDRIDAFYAEPNESAQ